MTDEEILLKRILDEMVELQKEDDYEFAHGRADTLLILALVILGQKDLADQWQQVGKWYA